jgi:hypothetical protein
MAPGTITLMVVRAMTFSLLMRAAMIFDILIGGDGGADRFVFHYPNEGIDQIRGFDRPLGDRIEVWRVGFGATSLSQFSLVNNTVYFDAKPNDAIAPVAFVRFEVYESPIPFVISRDIILF